MTREEKIRQVVQKYIATDKHNGVGVRTQAFIDGAEWADIHSASPWHSVANGDLPKELKNDDANMPFIVKTKDGKQYLAYYASWFDEEYCAIRHDFFDGCDCLLDVEYWMEIPKLPTE